jgi:threonylcarbamoyladenosine tRNA methylthiotransferase CDKAL1
MNNQELKKVYITANGCNRRLLDAKRLTDYFKKNQYQIVKHPKDADYILFFATALNDVRIKESWEFVERLKKHAGELILLGCLQEAVPSEFKEKWKGRHLRIKDMNKIDEFFPEFKHHYKEIAFSNKTFPIHGIYKGVYPKICFRRIFDYIKKPYRILDKIQSIVHKEKQENFNTTFIWLSQGCPNKCSFCAERKTVGDLISRPIEEIAQEYSNLIKDGKTDFELIGDDVGSYGIDIGTDLPALIKRLNEVDKGENIRWVIKHLHPKFIIKYRKEILTLAQTGKTSEIICSFQSGSNRILELMNRNHTIEEIIDTLKMFRQEMPEIKLATNIIVGFPSETEEEFQKTLDVFNSIYFDRVHLLKYFEAEGSDSSLIPDKVDDTIINKRIKKAKKFFRTKKIYCQSRD